MWLTGVEPSRTPDDLPPILAGGHAAAIAEQRLRNSGKGMEQGTLPPNEQNARDETARELGTANSHPPAKGFVREPAAVASPSKMRYGRPTVCLKEDVTANGSVASGGDVTSAGGSNQIRGQGVASRGPAFLLPSRSRTHCGRRLLRDGRRNRRRAAGVKRSNVGWKRRQSGSPGSTERIAHGESCGGHLRQGRRW